MGACVRSCSRRVSIRAILANRSVRLRASAAAALGTEDHELVKERVGGGGGGDGGDGTGRRGGVASSDEGDVAFNNVFVALLSKLLSSVEFAFV